MRLLIFDPHVVGHHLEHLDHLSEYVVQRSKRSAEFGVGDLEVHMAVHPHITEHAPGLMDQAQRTSRLALHPLTDSEFDAIESASGLQRSWAMWRAASRVAEQVHPDHCLFMEINSLQPIVGLPRAKRVEFSISGILFFPFCRIEPDSTDLLDQGRAKLERLRKYLQIKWVLTNPNVEHLFVLNDPLAAQELQDLYQWQHFSSLPDPVVELVGADRTDGTDSWVGKREKWKGGRLNVTLFGSLREGKGVRQLLQAVRFLPESIAKQINLHLLGAPRGDLADDLSDLVKDLREAQPSLQVQYEGRFLSDAELHTVLTATDVIAAPYQRTEGSSGVLGHAAKYKCPVIGPRTGLVGDLIERYELGMRIDTTCPRAIAEALQACVQSSTRLANEKRMEDYVRERSPEAFAKCLVETIVPEDSR